MQRVDLGTTPIGALPSLIEVNLHRLVEEQRTVSLEGLGKFASQLPQFVVEPIASLLELCDEPIAYRLSFRLLVTKPCKRNLALIRARNRVRYLEGPLSITGLAHRLLETAPFCGQHAD